MPDSVQVCWKKINKIIDTLLSWTSKKQEYINKNCKQFLIAKYVNN